jgi:spore coat protein U-like protein
MNRLTLLTALALTATAAQVDALTCSLTQTVPVSFGGYDVFDPGARDSAGSIVFRCDNVGLSDGVIVDLSAGHSASYNPRAMLGAGDVMQYNLFLDAAATTVWGNGTGGTGHYGPARPPEGQDVRLNVFGRIPPQQNITVGSYSDTIVLTISF